MDSPIEALVFDHLTLVNNLWTWIALVTAALSFWWIRASSAVISISLQSHPISTSPDDCTRSRSNSPDASFSEASTHSEPPMLSSPAPSTPSIFEDGDSITKGKFLVYYEDDRENDGEVEGESESEVLVAGEWEYGGCGEWTESLERVVRMRMGDLGWYRCQDLTAINGNVVRLWDGVRL
ncbi:uncharacterized protein [Euphorbia lathyris]|uniref:uncharacterized protein n=1 Tax=Euphorbia lathyris TaxID=212925 RepID=UPI0033134C12